MTIKGSTDGAREMRYRYPNLQYTVHLYAGINNQVLTMAIADMSQSLYADELPVNGTSLADVDTDLFHIFVEKKYHQSLADLNIGMEKCMENLNLLKGGQLTLAGLLLFGKSRRKYRPQFSVQCITATSNTLIDNMYLDNELSTEGPITQVFARAMSFIDRNIKKVQVGNSFNSLGEWEIPYDVFLELLVNALVHRDYFISATIKVIIYTDRIAIISPGTLPNSLTIDHVLNGISIARNPILQSVAQYVLPYKGLGTGISRAKALYPPLQLENDPVAGQFRAIIPRP